VCALSGMPAHPWCPARQRERLPAGDDPPCSWHHQADDGLIVVWPPVYRQWARDNGLQAEPRPAIVKASAANRIPSSASATRDRLEIVSPPSGATYMIDPTLRREFQTLPLRGLTSAPGTIEWQIAGRILGTSSSEAALDWPLTPGTHRIIAKDERGRTAESVVVVK
jgi:Penicillin-Binding Protein C-terminus Family